MTLSDQGTKNYLRFIGDGVGFKPNPKARIPNTPLPDPMSPKTPLQQPLGLHGHKLKTKLII